MLHNINKQNIGEYPSQLAFSKVPRVRFDSEEPPLPTTPTIKNNTAESPPIPQTTLQPQNNTFNNTNINNLNNNNQNDQAASYSYKPKHFIESKITLQTNQKSKQEAKQYQFTHQLAKQNADKNRQRQAKYYNKTKKKIHGKIQSK